MRLPFFFFLIEDIYYFLIIKGGICLFQNLGIYWKNWWKVHFGMWSWPTLQNVPCSSECCGDTPQLFGCCWGFVHYTSCYPFYAQTQEIGGSLCQGLLWSSWWTFHEHFKLGKGSWPSPRSGCYEPSSWPTENT